MPTSTTTSTRNATSSIARPTGLPVLAVTPKRDMLARYGVNVAYVQEAVSTATGGR